MSNSYESNIPSSLGAILLGGFGSSALSGLIGLQTFVYFRLYPADHKGLKLLVAWIWLVDAVHTCLITASSWENLAVFYGERDRADYIQTTTALTLFFTCVASFSVQSYYAQVLYKLSARKWHLAAPVVILSLARLAVGLVSTIKAVQIRYWTIFVPHQTSVITLGYALSVSVDVFVTISMCWFFAKSRSRDGLASTNKLIDTMITYAISSGLLTFLTTLASMICWFALQGTLVFMGTHFLIGKFYALAILTNLNTRRYVRERHYRLSSNPRNLISPAFMTDSRTPHHGSHPSQSSTSSQATAIGAMSPKFGTGSLPVQVNVERTIKYDKPPLIPLRKVSTNDSYPAIADLDTDHDTTRRDIIAVEREGQEYNPYDQERGQYGRSSERGHVGWGFGYAV